MRVPTSLFLVVTFTLVASVSFFAPSESLAQNSEAPAKTLPTKKPPPDPALVAKANECRQFAQSNKMFFQMMKNDLQRIVQEEDWAMTMRNKKHVVAAYAILWVLAIGFLALMFIRQRGLVAKIAGLEAQVRVAAAEMDALDDDGKDADKDKEEEE